MLWYFDDDNGNDDDDQDNDDDDCNYVFEFTLGNSSGSVEAANSGLSQQITYHHHHHHHRHHHGDDDDHQDDIDTMINFPKWLKKSVQNE